MNGALLTLAVAAVIVGFAFVDRIVRTVSKPRAVELNQRCAEQLARALGLVYRETACGGMARGELAGLEVEAEFVIEAVPSLPPGVFKRDRWRKAVGRAEVQIRHPAAALVAGIYEQHAERRGPVEVLTFEKQLATAGTHGAERIHSLTKLPVEVQEALGPASGLSFRIRPDRLEATLIPPKRAGADEAAQDFARKMRSLGEAARNLYRLVRASPPVTSSH